MCFGRLDKEEWELVLLERFQHLSENAGACPGTSPGEKKVKLVIFKKIKRVFLKVNYNYKCRKLNSYLEE